MKKLYSVIIIIELIIISLPISLDTYAQSYAKVKKVAILETVDKEGKLPYGVKLMVRSKLAYAITNTPGYEGYDRVDITQIMEEHEFQRTGMVNDSQIKQLGEMVGADYILIAETAYLNNSHIFITAQILNVESAKLEKTANIQTTVNINDLEQNCQILAGKLLDINIVTGALKGELMIGEDRYVGEHKNGKPHGQGIMYFSINDSADRKSYEGNWENGVRKGQGTMIWNDGEKYIGNWDNNIKNGFGIYDYGDGERYEGEYKNGAQNGKGKYFWPSGQIYEGEFLEGKYHGYGIMIYASGERYEGEWVDDVCDGNGVYYYNNGDRYEGQWKNDKFNGYGKYYWTDGKWEEGYYVNDQSEGQFTYHFANGDYMIGNYVNGEMEGGWKYYYANGKFYGTRIYKNGERIK